MKTKHSPPVPVLSITTGLLLSCASFAAETPSMLISFVPDGNAVKRNIEADATVTVIDDLINEAEADAIMYSPPSSEDLARLDGELELLVFTAKEPGVCRACDKAREQWRDLVDSYPITPIYCSLSSKPRTRGDVIARHYDVEAFPTFVLVRRSDDGTAVELDRWKGAGSFFESTQKRIKRAFADAYWKPPKRKPGERHPFDRPRPIPGLNPPKPEPRKPPREVKPGTRPRGASIGFSETFEEIELDEE